MQSNSLIKDGFLVVPTPGTRLSLKPVVTPCSRVVISADDNNTSSLVVGGSTVVAAVGATRSGCSIQPGGSVAFDIDDLAKVFVDVITANDKVTFTYTA